MKFLFIVKQHSLCERKKRKKERKREREREREKENANGRIEFMVRIENGGLTVCGSPIITFCILEQKKTFERISNSFETQSNAMKENFLQTR